MNSPSKAGLAILVLAAGMLGSMSALADGPRGHARIGVHRGGPVLAHGYGRHGGGARLGIYLGAPLVWGGYYGPSPYYYPSPYYPPYYSPYYPPVVTVPLSPPTYIEQGEAGVAPEPGYWYYCADSRAYYPYVKECPGGWQRVSPQPPPG